jgi:hypothetical protein
VRDAEKRAPHGGVEAVEKVSKQILRQNAEKGDLIECATINDLMIAKGQERPPKTSFSLVKRTFPTGSLGTSMIPGQDNLRRAIYGLNRSRMND